MRLANPLVGEPSTGEPCAGEPHARFGGGRVRERNRTFLPLSYRYFHGDGYGKDFRVLNLKEETREEHTERLMLGNLLSFYEQQRVYTEQQEELQPYNLERPLWVFVGHSVIGKASSRDDRQVSSDVLQVVRFLHHFLENAGDWAVKGLDDLLFGHSGLEAADGTDLFSDRLGYLRGLGLNGRGAYADILDTVFHTDVGGGLHLCDLRGSQGELGLKATAADSYFGLVYIGDTSAFKRLAEEDDSGIVLEEDALTGSLFDDINGRGSTVDVLIGARKFMEGWNSWRVSNMGLLNIGRGEGSQIIQLFGRGVRLRGKDLTLKRSAAIPDVAHPDRIQVLETLDIFALRANYMAQFREYLEKEGVETEPPRELRLEIRPDKAFLGKGLQVLRLPEGLDFVSSEFFLLEPDPKVRVPVDLSLKVEVVTGGRAGITAAAVRSGQERQIPPEVLTLVDWEKAWFALLEHKERRQLWNLVVPLDAPRAILSVDDPAPLYSLRAEEAVFNPARFEDREQVQEAVEAILKRYVDAFYRSRRERWESTQMVYKVLNEEDPNLSFAPPAAREAPGTGYVVRVPASEEQLFKAVQKLVKDARKLYNTDGGELPRIHFSRHVYQPLLVEGGDKVTSSPPALKKGERQFVEDLRCYCKEEKDGWLAGVDVYLLRNLSKGVGIGFFEERGFYPDFILWLVKGRNQHIVFVEPHGMIHAPAYERDDKASLHKRLPELAKRIESNSGVKGVTLDSYVVSRTAFGDLQQRYGDGSWSRSDFTNAHILFQEPRMKEYDYIGAIVAGQLTPV